MQNVMFLQTFKPCGRISEYWQSWHSEGGQFPIVDCSRIDDLVQKQRDHQTDQSSQKQGQPLYTSLV